MCLRRKNTVADLECFGMFKVRAATDADSVPKLFAKARQIARRINVSIAVAVDETGVEFNSSSRLYVSRR